jgi:PHO85 cyclin-1
LKRAIGVDCTHHRVFLAVLIVSAKYLNDSSPKNSHWATYAKFLDVRQVTTIEREILSILDYDLQFDEIEACTFFAPFMSTDAQVAHTRAVAVDRVTQGRRTRALARQLQQGRPPSVGDKVLAQRSPNVKPRRMSIVIPAALHLSPDLVAPTMIPSFSSHSSCSTASELESLVDDTGSSSGYSSGWLSTDSESDSDDRYCPVIHDDSSPSSDASSQDVKKPFTLRPVPLRARKSADHSRIPSNASSVCTVRASPPVSSASCSAFSSAKGVSKRSLSGLGDGKGKDCVVTSSTMPSISRIGVTGSFLSRMWGAAKGQALGQDRSAGSIHTECAVDSRTGQNALRKLVLNHTRHGSKGIIPDV